MSDDVQIFTRRHFPFCDRLSCGPVNIMDKIASPSGSPAEDHICADKNRSLTGDMFCLTFSIISKTSSVIISGSFSSSIIGFTVLFLTDEIMALQQEWTNLSYRVSTINDTKSPRRFRISKVPSTDSTLFLQRIYPLVTIKCTLVFQFEYCALCLIATSIQVHMFSVLSIFYLQGYWWLLSCYLSFVFMSIRLVYGSPSYAFFN